MTTKNVQDITISDIIKCPVWEFTDKEDSCDVFVKPINELPCRSLDGRVVGTQVVLANGTKLWSLLSNIDVENAKITEHFLTLSVNDHGKWSHLARYHDYDYDDRGPAALAAVLRMAIDEVFPIRYDVSKFATGTPDALSGEISKVPRERLSRSELAGLAVPQRQAGVDAESP